MDPNVQVAFVSVLVAIVTTSGVVVTALINRPSRGSHSQTSRVDDDETHLDETDVLERMLGLMRENERKEESIGRLRIRNEFLELENDRIEAENRLLKAENAKLILQTRDGKP